MTLQLFDTLLQKDDQHILDNLVLRNLAARGYYDTSHHDKNTGLPGHVQEEFNNIVKQSGQDRDKDNKTENVEDNSAIETNNSVKVKLSFEHLERTDLKEVDNDDKHDKGASVKCTNDNASSHDDNEATVFEPEEKVISSVDGDDPADIDMSQTEQSQTEIDDAHKTNSIRNPESSNPEILSKAPCDTDASVDILPEAQGDIVECNNTDNPSSSSIVPVNENVDTHDNEKVDTLDIVDSHENVDTHKNVDTCENVDTLELTDKLESQTTESQESHDNVNTEKESLSNDTYKLCSVGVCEDVGRVPGVSPRRSKIEVHNVVNW